MTCIIATPRFMLADRRITADGQISTARKVGRSRAGLIAGASGNGCSTLAVLAALRKGASSPEDLLLAVDKESTALVLSPDGRLYQLLDGAVWPLPTGVHAIGSGADLALGFLAGLGRSDPSAARRAQRFVAQRRADCGSGTNLIEIPC